MTNQLKTVKMMECRRCGYKNILPEAPFCPRCGLPLGRHAISGSPAQPTPSRPHRMGDGVRPTLTGILITNTDALARKYGCEPARVTQLLTGFIEGTVEWGMEWHLLDVAEQPGAGGKAEPMTWRRCNDLVTQVVEADRLPVGPDLHLFIIGGDDVIPVPRVDNPYEHATGEIATDMPYCFPGNYIPDFVDGKIAGLQAGEARNNVARLPLEDGKLDTRT